MITKITQHPKYVQGVAYFDIAVLEIELVKFTANVRPICLPSSKGFRIDKFNHVKHFYETNAYRGKRRRKMGSSEQFKTLPV
jgi:hypothetical protein